MWLRVAFVVLVVGWIAATGVYFAEHTAFSQRDREQANELRVWRNAILGPLVLLTPAVGVWSIVAAVRRKHS